MEKTLDKVLIDLELDSKVAFLDKESDENYLHTLTKETKNRLSILSPDAVYIFNGRPLILFYDLDKNPKDKSDLHKKIWSFDDAPIVFIIEKSDVEVFNALNYVKDEGKQGLEILELSFEKEIKERFNLWELESGQTWKWFQDTYLKSRSKRYKKRVNERLFANIKLVRNHLIEEEELSNHQANSLILRLIFIRYLIDRKVKIDEKLLPGKPKEVNQRRKALIELIRQPAQLNELFEKLNDKFNGVLFKELDTVLTQKQADDLADIFAGELQKDNLFEGFFFEIFDFSVIPVELISGIYESLIDEDQRNEDSAIYTPSFLVDYILKDTVDEFLKTHKPEECTVFEVAVGSGIFLVQSLRRMIEKEIELNGKANKKEFGEKIKALAKNNLYGVDINPEALKVTCFSIYIALLDYLEPADINTYKFPALIGKSLFEANFFGKIENGKLLSADFEKEIHKVKPKFILGNPPWKSKKKDLIHKTWLSQNKRVVGNYEIAQSFLLRVKDFMLPDTRVSLIVTSTMFYNVSKTTRKFKNEILTSYCIDQFFDLSAVKQTLFEHQESPASILFFRLAKEDDYKTNIVKHRGLKVNSLFKAFKILALEKYDQKEIIQSYFIEFPWMFKVALYGNRLDFELLKKMTSSKAILEDEIEKEGFFATSGILRGNRKKQFPELQGLPIIENSDVKKLYTPKANNRLTKKDLFLEAGRGADKFDKPKILFKEQALNWTELVISLNLQSSVFVKGVYGMASSDTNRLKKYFSYLITNLYTYYIFITSCGWGVATKPQIRWKEYLSFPIKHYSDETCFKQIEAVENIIENIIDFQNIPENKLNSDEFDPHKLLEVKLKLKEINETVNSLYGLKDYEKDLIDYVLDVSRYQFQESKQNKFLKKVDKDKEFLANYANVFLEEINDLYPEEHLQVEIYTLKHFIAMNFVLSDEAPKERIIYPKRINEEAVLQKLADNLSVQKIVNTSDPEKNLFIQRDIKGFEKDSFYIIKPNELKSWHRARAWYDLAEIKEALQQAEINSLNNTTEWV